MNWIETNNKLEKEFTLKSFSEIIEKLNQLAVVADELDHHPDFLVHSYKKISFSLCTHSAGNSVTEKDRNLAKRIDAIFE